MKAQLAWLGREDNAPYIALLLAVAALVVRLTALLVFPELHISGNARDSILGGAALIRSGEFVNNADYPMLVPPLTALFTAAVQSVFGDHLLPVKLFQIILDACTVVLVFFIGTRALGQLPAALGAAFLTVYPFSVLASLYIGTEALFTFLLALSVLLVTKGLEDDAKYLFFLSGLAVGLATLTRGTTLFVPIFLCAFLILCYNKKREFRSHIAASCALLVLGFVLTLTPWTVRNWIVLDAFIPASTSHGPMLHGSSEEFWLIADRERELPKYFDYLASEKGIMRPGGPKPSWVEKDRYYKRAALEKYRDRWESDPVSFLSFLTKKFVRLWYATESGTNTALVISINLPVYALAMIGLWSFFRRPNRPGSLLVLLVAYFVVIHVLVFGYFRYMVPVMPYVILFSAYGALHLRSVQFGREISSRSA